MTDLPEGALKPEMGQKQTFYGDLTRLVFLGCGHSIRLMSLPLSPNSGHAVQGKVTTVVGDKQIYVSGIIVRKLVTQR
jgi:hypothetical protein